MAGTLSDAEVAAVREVIDNCTLRGIEFHELTAKRPDEITSESVDGQLTIEVQLRTDAHSFGVRLNALVVLPTGEAKASVAGEYELPEDFSTSERSLRMFANEVAVMTVFPYLREAIASVTGRVFGNPVYLPLVQRGEIALDVDDESADVQVPALP